MGRFNEWFLLRELDEKKTKENKPAKVGVSTSIKLGNNNEFPPFVITDDPRHPEYPSHENLAPVVQAFLDASKVKVYDSISSDGKNKSHNLSKKKLFLVGGSVRDHLTNQSSANLELATDATSDEIRMILHDAGFKEIGPKETSSKQKWFSVKRKDKKGKEFVFNLNVNGENFELSTFRKAHAPDNIEFGSHQDDANRRDMNINSMYLNLTNPNGPNSDLIDFHGGIHSLINGDIKFIGNPEEKIGEDYLRALRYARFAAKFGKGNLNPQIASLIKKVGPQIAQNVDPSKIREEFLKGLKYEDVDPSKFIKIYKDLGLLDICFPGLKPDDCDGSNRDPALLIASLFKNNDPKNVKNVLQKGTWSSQEQGRVKFLQDILNLSPATDPDTFQRYIDDYKQSGILDKSVEDWFVKNRKDDPDLIRAFLTHVKSPKISVVYHNDDQEFPQVHPDFSDLFNPLNLKPLPGMESVVESRKKQKNHECFLETYSAILGNSK